MCPTVIFATSRTVRVRGRIIIEIVSINTKRGDKANGAPLGERWAAMITGTIFTWAIKIDDQNRSPMIAANQIVEVTGNVKGVIPKRFKVIKVRKILRNHPLLSLILTLFIICPNFLTAGTVIGAEGVNKTRKGSNQRRLFP